MWNNWLSNYLLYTSLAENDSQKMAKEANLSLCDHIKWNYGGWNAYDKAQKSRKTDK